MMRDHRQLRFLVMTYQQLLIDSECMLEEALIIPSLKTSNLACEKFPTVNMSESLNFFVGIFLLA
jgi:hypothetical protein